MIDEGEPRQIADENKRMPIQTWRLINWLDTCSNRSCIGVERVSIDRLWLTSLWPSDVISFDSYSTKLYIIIRNRIDVIAHEPLITFNNNNQLAFSSLNFSYFCLLTSPFAGDECPRVWDGLLCWPPTPANVTSHLGCPEYVDGFDVLVSPLLFLSCQIWHPISFLTDGCWSMLDLCYCSALQLDLLFIIYALTPDDRAHFLFPCLDGGVRAW